MPQFAFVAKDRLGNTVQGKLDAPNAALAANQIGQMGYALVDISPAPAPSIAPPSTATSAGPAPQQQARTPTATMAPPPGSAPITAASRTVTTSPAHVAATAPIEPTAPPGAVAGPTDLFQTDADKRRKAEADLMRMGMKPDEIRRLLNASANTTAAPPSMSPSPAVTPPTILMQTPPTRASKNAAKQKLIERGADLQSFAAQLQSSNSAARVQQVEEVTLDLPPFRESTRQEREQAEAALREVFALRRREKYVEALTKCRAALDLIPSDAPALETYGDLLQGLARTNEAMAAYKRATEADAKRASAERKYGDLLMRQQQWSEADPEEVPKSPVAAAVFSLLIPGAGQLHIGETVKGVALIVCAAISMAALFFLTRNDTPYDTTGEKHTRGPARIVRERTHFDVGTQWPIAACVGFYAILSLGSAVDAANGARRTRR